MTSQSTKKVGGQGLCVDSTIDLVLKSLSKGKSVTSLMDNPAINRDKFFE